MGKAQDIIETLSDGGNITSETIEEMIDTITEEIDDDTIADIETLVDVANDLGYQIEIPGATEEIIEENKETINDTINDKVEAGLINEDLANKIKEMLGLTGSAE